MIGFAGFLSKDAIIESAYAGTDGGFAFWALVIAALFTSFYSWRLMFLTFWGEPRGDMHAHEHAHESPPVMTIPLGALAVGSVLAGMVWVGPFFGDHDQVNEFFGIPAHAEAGDHGEAKDDHGDDHATDDHATDDHAVAKDDHADEGEHDKATTMDHHDTPQGAIYMAPDNHVLDDAHHAPKWVKVSPFIAMITGFAIALAMYIQGVPKIVYGGLGLVAAVVLFVAKIPLLTAIIIGAALAALFAAIPYGLNERLAKDQRPLYLFLLNKWYVDEIYDFLFVNPAKCLGNFLWKRGDGNVIDGFLNGVAMGIVPWFTRLAGRWQSGYLFTYAFAMVIGIAILISIMTLGGGAN